MKIIESSSERLVARDRGITGYITGGVMMVAGVILIPYGLSHHTAGLWGTGIGLVLVGAAIIVFNRSELLTADKASGTVAIVMKSLTGQKSAQYTFDQIAEVRALQEYRQTSNGSGTSRGGGGGISFGTGGVGVGGSSSLQLETTTMLILNDGTSVVIEKVTSNAGMGMVLSTQQSDGIGRPLAELVGKPYQLVAPNMNPAAVVQAVVGAITGRSAQSEATVAPVTSAAPMAAPPVAPAVAAPPAAPQPGNPEAAGFAMPATSAAQAPVAPVGDETPRPPQA